MINPRNIKSSGARRAFGLWEPSDLPGLWTWFDASDSTDTTKINVSYSSPDTEVVTWKNLSDNGSTHDFSVAGTTSPIVSVDHKIGGLDTIEMRDGLVGFSERLAMTGGAKLMGPNTGVIKDTYFFSIQKTISLVNSNGIRVLPHYNMRSSYHNSHFPWSSGAWFIDVVRNGGYYRMWASPSTGNIQAGDVWMGGHENSEIAGERNIRINGENRANGLPSFNYYGPGHWADASWNPRPYGSFVDEGGTYNGEETYKMYNPWGAYGDHAYLWWDGTNWKITDVGVDTGGYTKEATGGTTAADPTAGTWSNVTGFTGVGTLNSDDTTNSVSELGATTNVAIGEVITAHGVQLTTLEQQKIEGYLAHKWGQTALLPAGHPYKTIPPKK